MKITRLARAKTTNRINIDVDGEYSFSVEENTLIKFNLYKDKAIDTEEIKKISTYDQVEYLRSKALDYLGVRLRSKQEIVDYLKKKQNKRYKETDEDIVKNIVDKLEEEGYLDDKTFAQWFIESKLNQNKGSLRKLRYDIKKYGIDQSILEELTNENKYQNKEKETLEYLYTKKLKQLKLKNEPASKTKEKLIRYLSSKGFSWDQINKIIENSN